MKGVREYLSNKGIPDTPQMGSKRHEWRAFYNATHKFYDYERKDNTRGITYRRKRKSLRLPHVICSEWSSLLINERTQLSTDSQATTEWLNSWLDEVGFMQNAQEAIEMSFAEGTGAWVLVPQNISADGAYSKALSIDLEFYTADNIYPQSWSKKSCTEAAFTTQIILSGEPYTQLLHWHLNENKLYDLDIAFFDKNGNRAYLDGYASEIKNVCSFTPFALIKPNITNTYSPYSCFGVSVYDEALDAIKLADEAFDNMHQDIELGRKLVAISESMLSSTVEYDADGQARRRFTVPQESGKYLFMIGEQDGELWKEYNPDLRVEDNRRAIVTALQIVGKLTGMGNDYFSLEGASGIRTATEVVAEQSPLFRTVRRHENELAGAIQTICRSAIDMHASLSDPTLAAPKEINISFDDSVIEDVSALQDRDQREVALGLLAPYEYRMKWKGEDEKTARQAVKDMVLGNIPSGI